MEKRMARGDTQGPATTGWSGNFADLAQTKVADVERPKPIPEGHYLAQITGPMTQHKAAKSGNVAMRFPCKVIGAGEDVDQAEFNAARTGQDGNSKDVKFNLDFWMSPDARYRFTDFGKAQGASDDLNLIELAEWLVGDGNKPFLIQNKHRVDEQNADNVFNNFDNPTVAE
jgi:hypothetical protein